MPGWSYGVVAAHLTSRRWRALATRWRDSRPCRGRIWPPILAADVIGTAHRCRVFAGHPCCYLAGVHGGEGKIFLGVKPIP